MISFNELKKEVTIIMANQPYQIIETSFLFKGRGSSVLQAKLKNLITGNVISKTFHPADEFEEAEIEKIKVKFLYTRREEFWFCKEKNPAERFSLPENIIGGSSRFLKPNMILGGLLFKDKIINISLPIKTQLKVIEAPPGVKGDRAQGGTKTVTLETGAKIDVPLFIEAGDVIEVNTETGEYVRRM